MLRAVLIAASAVATGLAMGRRVASREVERRKSDAVEEIIPVVRERIRDQARLEVARQLRHFFYRTLLKAVCLSLLWFAFWFGIAPAAAGPLFVPAVIGFLIAFDIWHSWPTLKWVAQEVRQRGWVRPRRAIGELVAAQVFDQVLLEATDRMPTRWHERAFLRAAGTMPDDLSREIARAVAELARETSWQDLRPFIVGGIIRAVTVSVLYAGFAWLVLSHVSAGG